MAKLVHARVRGALDWANCLRLCLALGTVLSAGLAQAVDTAPPRVLVSGAWVRGTVEGQTGSGAYLRLTSREDARLVGASSAIASKVEIHEMRVVNNMMTMRAVDSLALPANTTVALEHGYHIMLIGLRQTLETGQSVKITLHLLDAAGLPFDIDVLAPVRALNASPKHE
jgi:copper(I)-binding protein